MKIGLILFRTLFAFTLIILGLRGIIEVNGNKVKITETIDRFEKEILAPYNLNMNLQLLKEHPIEIIYFQNICLIYGAFLLIFGLSLSKAFISSCLLLEFLLVSNIYFNRDYNTIKYNSIMISLLGAILTINK